MRMIGRPKGWIKADSVRVVRNGGKLVVQVKRKRKPAKRKAAKKRKSKSNPSRKRKTTRPTARRTQKRAKPRKKGKR